MLREETISRLTEKAKSLNMSTDMYVNYLMDTKLTSQVYGGAVKTLPINQLPFTDGEVLQAIVLKIDNKYFKFRVNQKTFKVKTPKNLQNSKFEFNQKVELLYTEYTSKNKTYARIQLHRAYKTFYPICFELKLSQGLRF